VPLLLDRNQAVRFDRLLTGVGKNIVDEILDLVLRSPFHQEINRTYKLVAPGDDGLVRAFLLVDFQSLDFRIQETVGKVPNSVSVVGNRLANGSIGVLNQCILGECDVRDDLFER
jgi:hypothetical protein